MDIRGYFSSKRDAVTPGVYLPERGQLIGPDDEMPDLEDGEPHVCVVQPGETWLLETTEKFRNGDISQTRYETLLLLQCVREVREDEHEAPVWRDGRPLPGPAVWERADIEMLESDTHKPGGWLRQMKDAVGQYVQAAKAELTPGKSLGG